MDERRGYRKLIAWQKADDFAFELVGLCNTLRRDFQWLAPQIRRSATSVPSNIVEGYSRASIRDYLRHLSVARGSLAETEYYLHFLNRCGAISSDKNSHLEAMIDETGSLLYGLIRSLAKKMPSEANRGYTIGEGRFPYGHADDYGQSADD